MEKDNRISQVEQLLNEWYKEKGGAYLLVTVDGDIQSSTYKLKGDTKKLASTIVTYTVVDFPEFGKPFNQVVNMYKHIIDHPVKVMEFIKKAVQENNNPKEEES